MLPRDSILYIIFLFLKMSARQTPNSIKTQFKTNREEPCTAQISLRIPPSQKAKLKNIDGWQEEARRFLDLLIERQEKKSA